MEVGINNHNKDILYLMESNMDIQFVLEIYGLATYVINHIGKVDAGMCQMLRDAAAEMKLEMFLLLISLGKLLIYTLIIISCLHKKLPIMCCLYVYQRVVDVLCISTQLLLQTRYEC